MDQKTKEKLKNTTPNEHEIRVRQMEKMAEEIFAKHGLTGTRSYRAGRFIISFAGGKK